MEIIHTVLHALVIAMLGSLWEGSLCWCLRLSWVILKTEIGLYINLENDIRGRSTMWWTRDWLKYAWLGKAYIKRPIVDVSGAYIIYREDGHMCLLHKQQYTRVGGDPKSSISVAYHNSAGERAEQNINIAKSSFTGDSWQYLCEERAFTLPPTRLLKNGFVRAWRTTSTALWI